MQYASILRKQRFKRRERQIPLAQALGRQGPECRHSSSLPGSSNWKPWVQPSGISKALAALGESSTACHSPQLGAEGIEKCAAVIAEGLAHQLQHAGDGGLRASVGTDVLRSQRATWISRDQQAAAPCQLDR